jgi:hypothetical protein
MKLFMNSLKNNRTHKIFLDMERTGDILLHLTDKDGHITGYYLMGINGDGMFLIGDIGETDSSNDVVKGIDLDYEESKLRVIGIDLYES